jgi:hypothetical protein
MFTRIKNFLKKTPAEARPPPLLVRTPTDESKEQTISTLTEPRMMPTLLKRQTSLDSDATMQGYDEREKSFQYLKKVLTPSMFDYYIRFLNGLPEDYKESLARPSNQRTKMDNNLIHSIFDMIDPIDTPLLVYRCYKEDVNFKTLNTQKSNTVLSSTTLSFKYANGWCNNVIKPGIIYDYQRPNKSNFMICILILPGTKIIPLIADYLENKRVQYELLLDSRSTLHYTRMARKNKSHIPIFVSLPGNDISVNNAVYERNKIRVQQIIEKEEKEEKDRLDEIYRNSEWTDDVDHFMKLQDEDMKGGKYRKSRIFKKTRKSRKYKKTRKSRKYKKY